MAIKSDYISGTLSLSNGSRNFTGTGTGWSSAGFKEGDTIIDVTGATEYMGVIEFITGETTGTLTKNWEGPTLSGVAYRMRYQPDGARSTAQARNLIEILGNGNITAFASLSGAANLVPLFTGPGAMTLVSKQSLVSGAAYNVQVANLAARGAYDGQDAGFAVLVADMGDGRAAIYSKNSATSGDWSDPAYITGPIGPSPEVEATVSQLPPGSTATVTEVPITGGFRLDFALPDASGFYNAGVYDIAEAYSTDDVVRHNGSSFIALQAVPAGTSPSNVFPPVDTAFWQVLAAKGADGIGTGDMVGPSSSTANGFVGFADTGGKQTKQLTSAQATAGLDIFEEDAKGLVPGPTSVDISANRLLQADGTWVDPPSGGGGSSPEIAAIALEVADLKGGRFGMNGGYADPFDDESGVDASASTNEVYDPLNGLYRPTATPAAWSDVVTVAVNANGSSTANVLDRNRIPSSLLADIPGSRIRIEFTASTAASLTIHTVWVGKPGATNDFDGSQVQMTTDGGATSIVIPAGQARFFEVDYAFTGLEDLMVSFLYSGAARYNASGGTGWQRWVKTGSNTTETAADTVTGLSAPSANSNITSIAVIVSPEITQNMTLVSEPWSAQSAPDSSRFVLQVDSSLSLTPGVDFDGAVSRDGGVTFTSTPLALTSELGSVKLYEFDPASISSQPSGTDMVWRARTLTNKDIAFSGVVQQWS